MRRKLYPYTRQIILALELMAVETAHDSSNWNAAIRNFLHGGVTRSKGNPSEAVPHLAMSLSRCPHSVMSTAPMSTSSNIGLYYTACIHSPGMLYPGVTYEGCDLSVSFSSSDDLCCCACRMVTGSVGPQSHAEVALAWSGWLAITS